MVHGGSSNGSDQNKDNREIVIKHVDWGLPTAAVKVFSKRTGRRGCKACRKDVMLLFFNFSFKNITSETKNISGFVIIFCKYIYKREHIRNLILKLFSFLLPFFMHVVDLLCCTLNALLRCLHFVGN